MPAFKKTNAMRMLDSAGINYECKEYEFDENDLDGHHVAEYLGVPSLVHEQDMVLARPL